MHGQLLQALSMAGKDGWQVRYASKFTIHMLSREAHSPPLPGALHAPVALGGQPLLGTRSEIRRRGFRRIRK